MEYEWKPRAMSAPASKQVCVLAFQLRVLMGWLADDGMTLRPLGEAEGAWVPDKRYEAESLLVVLHVCSLFLELLLWKISNIHKNRLLETSRMCPPPICHFGLFCIIILSLKAIKK